MTVVHILVWVLSLAGFIGLALAMPKHSKHILRAKLNDTQQRACRAIGWALLALAFVWGIGQWNFDIGSVTWLAWLTIAGVVLVFFLPFWPWRPDASDTDKAPRRGASQSQPGGTRRTAVATILLALPLGAFSWQLLNTPDKPLLRDDALHGTVGPWTFTLAEYDLKTPEIVALEVPLKAFAIRFCEACQRDIRIAYLKVRKPHSLRAAGMAFGGRGAEKEVEIPIPRATNLQDEIWLTVEGTNGQVYQQSFAITELSPALAGFIERQESARQHEAKDKS